MELIASVYDKDLHIHINILIEWLVFCGMSTLDMIGKYLSFCLAEQALNVDEQYERNGYNEH